jgi:DNA-binding response OmpR family regulator
VLTANNGKEAIEIYSQLKDTIDLVVLDLVMPDMGGEEVFNQIRSLNQDIKVLFASGHYVGEQTRDLLKTGASDFLQKPFNLRQLSTKIRGLFDDKK